MNILVTGGAGYIGSITVEMLLEQGHQVLVIDDLRDGNREAVLEPALLIEGDCGDVKLLNSIFKNYSVDIVIHFAASANIPQSIMNPELFYYNNILNGFFLLDTMIRFNYKKIIFSSSAAVYGEPDIHSLLEENHPTRPVNSYGETKLMFERMLYWYHKAYNLRSNSFRYFNVAGASKNLGEARKEENHLLPLTIDTVLGKRGKLFVYGNDYPTKDGTCIRDYVHVSDIARAHILAIENLDRHPYEIYNLGCGCSGYSILEVIDIIEKITGKKVDFEFINRRFGDPAFLVASNDKAKKDLGWEPEFGLEEMIESDLEWQREGRDRLKGN